jgi:hypothetical protein
VNTLLGWSRGALVAVSLGALVGCPNPNTYGTPRTIPPGEVQHTVGLDAIYVRSKPRGQDGDSATLPMFPSYQLRRGLSDRVDIAARITNFSGFGADVKWNFVRGPIDLALDPGAQWAYVTVGDGFSVFFLHAPLLAGFKLARDVDLVLTPGAVLALEAGTSRPVPHTVISTGGLLARFGVGVNVRTGRQIAIMPEVTAMRAFNDSAGIVLVAGFGIKPGAQPLADGETSLRPPDDATVHAPTDDTVPAIVPAPADDTVPAPVPASEQP